MASCSLSQPRSFRRKRSYLPELSFGLARRVSRSLRAWTTAWAIVGEMVHPIGAAGRRQSPCSGGNREMVCPLSPECDRGGRGDLG